MYTPGERSPSSHDAAQMNRGLRPRTQTPIISVTDLVTEQLRCAQAPRETAEVFYHITYWGGADWATPMSSM